MNKLLATFIFLSAINQYTFTKQLATNLPRWDGFGAQFQTLIYSVIYAELHEMDFVYSPFEKMEHNYDNDPNFLAKKECLINFIDNFEMDPGNALKLNWWDMVPFFEQNLSQCVSSNSLQKIKQIFRANKNIQDYFDQEHFNIVIHMRRPNPHDNRIDGANTPEEIYLNIITKLRIQYASQNPLFHVHSQGTIDQFKQFNAPDIRLHLNDSIEDSFTSMVLADVLVTSRSSYSYTAGILSEGTVFYMSFWHPPLPGWIMIDQLLK